MIIYKLAIDIGGMDYEKQEGQESKITDDWIGEFGMCMKMVYQGKGEGIVKEFLSLGIWEGDLLLIPIIPYGLEIEMEELGTLPVPEELVEVDLPSDIQIKVPRPVADLITFLLSS